MTAVNDTDLLFNRLTETELDSYEGGLGGLTRREFLKYCTGIAATMGLPTLAGMQMAQAATAAQRPPVIWLHGQECTGCTESLLRSYHPTLESLILDTISLDYHETLCVGAGKQAEAHCACWGDRIPARNNDNPIHGRRVGTAQSPTPQAHY